MSSLLHIDDHLVDLARELTARPCVVLRHRCFRVEPHTCRFVGREDRKLRLLDPAGTHGFSVNVEGCGTAGAEFAAVIGKIHLHSGFSLGQFGGCGGSVLIDAEIIVYKDGATILHV